MCTDLRLLSHRKLMEACWYATRPPSWDRVLLLVWPALNHFNNPSKSTYWITQTGWHTYQILQTIQYPSAAISPNLSNCTLSPPIFSTPTGMTAINETLYIINLGNRTVSICPSSLRGCVSSTGNGNIGVGANFFIASTSPGSWGGFSTGSPWASRFVTQEMRRNGNKRETERRGVEGAERQNENLDWYHLAAKTKSWAYVCWCGALGGPGNGVQLSHTTPSPPHFYLNK